MPVIPTGSEWILRRIYMKVEKGLIEKLDR